MGTDNQNLPGFVSLTPSSGFGGSTNYGSSFLPAAYQGTRIGQSDRPIRYATVDNQTGRQQAEDQRAELDFIQSLNRDKLERDSVNPDVEGVIQSYELTIRMQREMPQVIDLSGETAATQQTYGIGVDKSDDMGRKCLLARRMIEAGVHFVEITNGNWNHHFSLNSILEESCDEVDQPIAALLADLAQRDLLKDTLVVWTGEFGRTPYAEGQEGRNHNTKAFSMWMAGGGVAMSMAMKPSKTLSRLQTSTRRCKPFWVWTINSSRFVTPDAIFDSLTSRATSSKESWPERDRCGRQYNKRALLCPNSH